MIKKYRNKVVHHFNEVLKIKTSPHSIALGFAVGTLIAILPTFGLGVFIGLLVILIFPKLSKISMFVAFALWNPLILIPLYSLEYQIGNIIFSDLSVVSYRFEILNQLFTYTRRFLVGNLIVAVVFSTASYFIVKKIVKSYRKRNKGESNKISKK